MHQTNSCFFFEVIINGAIVPVWMQAQRTTMASKTEAEAGGSKQTSQNKLRTLFLDEGLPL